MSGTVNISRRIFDHEFFADEPMTEREAWVWLIMEASWKPRKKRAGDYIVDLARGQLAASVRFMAAAWQWTPARAQRFVKRLQSLEMISVKTDTGVSVITICKYEEYQAGGKAGDTGPIQVRYTSDTNEKKDEIREEGKRREPKGSLSPDGDLNEAVAEYNASASQAGWPKVQVLSPARRSALKQRLAQCGGLPGWRIALAKARASPHCCGQNDRGWTASFDFLTQASSFAKLMEGNYDPRPNHPELAAHQRGAGGSHDSMVAAFARVARQEPH